MINAMLHKDVLPTFMGHTTDCLIQIEKLKGQEESYLIVNGNSANRRNVADGTYLFIIILW